ncbi:hypothetical protein HX793_14225 [Pseudomonas reactans]|uniref:hypothetical protein n=1 Tax=Pseudomonas reactans TaxID=117680 RepID=UPI0015A03A03|nr:hypothetical protein [Pseudomonas reactans]NWC86495.1 hypothetical protein [Pseudomonas reactans]NWD30931.1 hypothetical protein [Pseudomonas reactans]
MSGPYEKAEFALRAKDSAAFWAALAGVDAQIAAPLLAKLLLEDWHEEHEDIVFELGLIGDSCATYAIAQAAQKNLEYLIRWGNLEEFQRKCAYALARIGSGDSKVALELLAQQFDTGVSKYAEEGLKHWPMPVKKRG